MQRPCTPENQLDPTILSAGAFGRRRRARSVVSKPRPFMSGAQAASIAACADGSADFLVSGLLSQNHVRSYLESKLVLQKLAQMHSENVVLPGP